MRSFVTAAFVGALLLAGTAPTVAQVPGVEIRLNPRIGLYVPVSDLGSTTTETFSLENSLSLGLGAELMLPVLPFGIRANMDYATGSRIEEDGNVVESEVTLLALAGDLVFRPLPNIIILQPYLFAGGGLKMYQIESIDVNFEGDTSDPTVHLGFGLDFGLGPISLNAELSDYISWYELQGAGDAESEMQHDMFVSIGFAIGLL